VGTIATNLAVQGVQTHIHNTHNGLNLSASCMLCSNVYNQHRNNSNKISQTNNTTQTTRVQHHKPTNNKPSPQLVIANTPRAPGPSSLLSRTRACFQIEHPTPKRLHSFPRILQLACRPTSQPCFPCPLPCSCFPFFFPFPFLAFLHKTTYEISQWLEHANAELRSRRRRSFNRFLRIVRRRKSKCFFDVMVSRSRCCNSVASSQLCRCH
jgi:hypothetical protein